MGTPDLPPAPAPPPPAPDLTDEEVKAAKANERRRQLQMAGLSRSFNTIAVNSAPVPTLGKTILGG